MRDPFDDALDDIRVNASVLLHEAYAPPWAIAVPGGEALRATLGAPAGSHVVPFHLVRSGTFELTYAGDEPQRVSCFEVAICPSGEPHLMSFGALVPPLPLADVLSSNRSPAASRGPDATELICGVFHLRWSPLNPMLASLPRVMKVPTAADGVEPLLAHAATMLALEVAKGPTSFVISRLLEVFFAEAVRSYGRTHGLAGASWFRGLEDPRIGVALARVHGDPGAPWTVEGLAETCALSPSRFAARFREVTGQSAMSYVMKWRMTIACQRLRDTDDNLDRIARSVGYHDTASFSRAFKALLGRSPAHWRALGSG